MKINRLSARAVETLKEGRHADGGGLFLNVTNTGARSWLFIWKRAGKRRMVGLGSVATIGLKDARQKALGCRKAVAQGGEPVGVREARKAAAEAASVAPVPTFGEMADAYIATHRPGWKSKKHADQWEMTLGDTYCAALRKIAVDKITRTDVLEVLQPIWLTKAETASRIRGRIETVLEAAGVEGGPRYGMANPARWKGGLKHSLPKRSKLARGHHKAVPYKDMPTFMAALRTRDGIAASALEFAILTTARSGEVRGMKWSEIDVAAKTWTVPAERMKGGKEHIVPLCDRALAILEKPQIGELVFPGMKNQPLSNMALSTVMNRMKVDATPHGTARSSFRDWAGDETNFQHEVIEFCLAHGIDNETEAAYRRSTAIEKRREVLTAWEAYCNGE